MYLLFVTLTALTEAQDINMHLKPLRHQLEDLEQAEFDESAKNMAPLMHTVALVWSNSNYYNTPARIIVLLQEICNLIIEMVISFIYIAKTTILYNCIHALKSETGALSIPYGNIILLNHLNRYLVML